MTEEAPPIDKALIKVLTKALDELVSACMDEKGDPKSPDRRDVMRARSFLPASYRNSLVRPK